MTARLFGTDGVRGRANVDITPDLAIGLARAVGEGADGVALIGRDPRRSGQMLAAGLHAGFQSVGIDTLDAGIIPAGAASYLTANHRAAIGAFVSASHNPADDNGIKFFGRDGRKLSDAQEDAIEARYRAGEPWHLATGPLVGMRQEVTNAVERYVTHLAERMPYSLNGIQLALDCANGAAFRAAPLLFERVGADLTVFAAEPDGTNINDKCGATHPEYLAGRAQGMLGLAFDGDADRLVAIDEDGVPANGDVIMAVIADHLVRTGELDGGVVVVTVMSNLGFRAAMEHIGVEVVETAVGDRYVLEAMRRRGAVLGGEQSGHVILADRTTGDGLATGLKLLEVIAATGKPLAELRTVMTDYPQVLRNVRVAAKDGLDDCTQIWDAVRQVEEDLGDDGRVLVRPSGTEPVVRVMVEASTSALAAEHADRLASIVRDGLSAGSV